MRDEPSAGGQALPAATKPTSPLLTVRHNIKSQPLVRHRHLPPRRPTRAWSRTPPACVYRKEDGPLLTAKPPHRRDVDTRQSSFPCTRTHAGCAVQPRCSTRVSRDLILARLSRPLGRFRWSPLDAGRRSLRTTRERAVRARADDRNRARKRAQTGGHGRTSLDRPERSRANPSPTGAPIRACAPCERTTGRRRRPTAQSGFLDIGARRRRAGRPQPAAGARRAGATT
jgi:hypothetical protein